MAEGPSGRQVGLGSSSAMALFELEWGSHLGYPCQVSSKKTIPRGSLKHPRQSPYSRIRELPYLPALAQPHPEAFRKKGFPAKLPRTYSAGVVTLENAFSVLGPLGRKWTRRIVPTSDRALPPLVRRALNDSTLIAAAAKTQAQIYRFSLLLKIRMNVPPAE